MASPTGSVPVSTVDTTPIADKVHAAVKARTGR